MKKIYGSFLLLIAFTSFTILQEPVFTKKDFKKLGWLEGKWTGTSDSEPPFYEQHIRVNDSSIAILYFRDATFTGLPDTAWVYLQGSSIVHRSGKAFWKAVSLTDKSIAFVPINVKNSFRWHRKSKDEWNAILEWKDKDGKPITKNYSLKRSGR